MSPQVGCSSTQRIARRLLAGSFAPFKPFLASRFLCDSLFFGAERISGFLGHKPGLILNGAMVFGADSEPLSLKTHGFGKSLFLRLIHGDGQRLAANMQPQGREGHHPAPKAARWTSARIS